MSQNNFYKVSEVYAETYYQLPKILFTNNKYKELSNDAKVAFALLKDRFNYSVRNQWVDEQNNLYFIYTNLALKKILNCSEPKVIKIKNDLEAAHLLLQKRMGINQPNRLYLLKPEVAASDVYRQASLQSLDISGTKNSLVNLYKEHKDIDKSRYNIDTQKLDFSTAHFSPDKIEKQNKDLVNHANDFLTNEDSGLPVFLEPEAVQLLSFWCRTPQQMHRFIGIILNAKYTVEKEHKDLRVWIALDDPELKPLITKTLRRYFNALRSNEKHVKNVENYLYGTMQNLFGTWWNKQTNKQWKAKYKSKFTD